MLEITIKFSTPTDEYEVPTGKFVMAVYGKTITEFIRDLERIEILSKIKKEEEQNATKTYD